jgi:hypothetical protein
MPLQQVRSVRTAPTTPLRSSPPARPFLTPMRLALAIALFATGVLHPAARAQGAWRQTEFVIGTGNDPLTTSDLGETRRSLQFAKRAYFNLLTGSVAHTDDDHWVSFVVNPAVDEARLSAAADLGLKVFLSNNAYTGALATDVPPPIEAWDPSLPRTVLDTYGSVTADSKRDAAMWGYFLFDEPGAHPNTTAWVKAWIDSIHDNDKRSGDTNHRATFLNFSPGDTATMNALANDPDPDRRLDVASLDLYPFGPESGKPCPNQRWWYFTAQAHLKAAMGSRPYWVLAMASPAIFGPWSTAFCDPDANQLRFMAFGAAAAGAKGIIWMGYRPSPEYDSIPNPSYPLVDVDKPSCKYFELKEINHYLQDVVGPVVMANEHVGLFHQANGPRPEPAEYMPLVSGAAAAACPVANLGNDNLAVGVFRSAGSPGEYYLLVINKALTPQSASVQLDSAFAIAAAPSVVGYVGGEGFSPVASGLSFPVSLAGGEGRLFHLTKAPVGHVALLSPSGGEQWLAGEVHEVKWTPASEAVDITLYADLDDEGSGLAGPAIPLATSVVGGSYTFTMPDVASRAAHIVLGGYGAVSHQVPLRTAPVPAGPVSSWLVGDGECSMNGELAIGPSGQPTAVYQAGMGRVHHTSFDGASWSAPAPTAVPADHADWMDGYSTALAIGADGQAHIAALSGPVQFGEAARRLVHYFGPAQFDSLEEVAGFTGLSGIDIATTPKGDAVVAGTDGLGLVVRHKGASGWKSWGPAIPRPGIRNISLAVCGVDTAWVAITVTGSGNRTELAVYRVTPTTATGSLLVAGVHGLVSLALDPEGRPNLAFTVPSPDGGQILKFTAYDGTTWGTTQTVDASPGAIASVALAFQGTTPNIAYVSNHTARLARGNGTTWNLETIVAADAEGPISLAFSPVTGARWVMFRDPGMDGMRIVSSVAVAGAGCAECPARTTPRVALMSENPLRAGRTLAFEVWLPRPASLEMSLFDIAGRRVAAQPSQRYPAGAHHAGWAPSALAPGAYFLRVALDGEPVLNRRLVLLK